jgi:hypothetical protein
LYNPSTNTRLNTENKNYYAINEQQKGY